MLQPLEAQGEIQHKLKTGKTVTLAYAVANTGMHVGTYTEDKGHEGAKDRKQSMAPFVRKPSPSFKEQKCANK
jgi:hypothetical protein